MLSDRIRPTTLDDIVGQKHILSENAPLRKIIESGDIPNMIFYGPPGVGKTTVARYIADNFNMKCHKLNGTNMSVSDIKNIVASADKTKSALVYIDEIQYLNKKQQQSLLEYMENGSMTVIASTTENPYFAVYKAVISRSMIFEFKPVDISDLILAVKRTFSLLVNEINKKILIAQNVPEMIAVNAGGDVRKAVDTTDLVVKHCMTASPDVKISPDDVRQALCSANIAFDGGDMHYDLISALQKSIRGSDENAALYYAAALMESGDIISLTRRLLVIAAEDVGLAYPSAITITKACVDTALQLGLPEARIPIAEAIILLSTAPKSNSAEKAIDAAVSVIKQCGVFPVPRHLQNKHCDGVGNAQQGQNYLYPHDYPNHYVHQQYLPDQIKNHVYYNFGDNPVEQKARQYKDFLKDQYPF